MRRSFFLIGVLALAGCTASTSTPDATTPANPPTENSGPSYTLDVPNMT